MKSKLCVFFCWCFLFLRHSLLCWILFHILKNLFAHKFIGMLIRFHWVPFILSFDPESVLFGWHPKLFVCALCCQLPHSCVCWSKDFVSEIQRHTQGAIFGYALHISFHISIFYCLYRRRRHRRGRCRVVKRLQRLSLYKLKYTIKPKPRWMELHSGTRSGKKRAHKKWMKYSLEIDGPVECAQSQTNKRRWEKRRKMSFLLWHFDHLNL